MKYLDTKDGIVVVNDDGEAIAIRPDHRIRLETTSGYSLFAYEYEVTVGDNPGTRVETMEFEVVDFIDNALILKCRFFVVTVAIETGLDEPCIVKVRGTEFGTKRVLVLDNIRDFTVTAQYIDNNRIEQVKALAE